MRKFDVSPFIMGSTKLTIPCQAHVDGKHTLYTASTDECAQVDIDDIPALAAAVCKLATLTVKQPGQSATAIDPTTGKAKKPSMSGTMKGETVASMLDSSIAAKLDKETADREATRRKMIANKEAAELAAKEAAELAAKEPSEQVPAAGNRVNGKKPARV